MKPYFVEIRTVAVVMAVDSSHAYAVARQNVRDAVRDADPEIRVLSDAKSEADLNRHGWDGMCIPYGGDGNTRLSEIFAGMADEESD